MKRTLARLAGALFAVSFASSALAQEEFRAPEGNGEGFDTHLFRPAVDSKGFFTVNGTDILGSGDFSFGMVLDYGKNLLRTNDGAVPVDDMGEECDRGECVDGALGGRPP